MNNKELYKQAFGVLHASGAVSLSKEKPPEKKVFRPARKLVLLCACTALALGFAVTAYAAGEQILSYVFGWGSNVRIVDGIDRNGEYYHSVYVRTDAMTEPVALQNGKMIFLVNGESLDITDKVSQTEAFVYEYDDADGNTHLWLVGLNSGELANYGYAEYIKRADGTWIGGYSARVNGGENGTTSAVWLESAKQEQHIEW